MKKPVYEKWDNEDWGEVGNLEYRAAIYLSTTTRKHVLFLLSDSLINLKKEIKARGFKGAWIAAQNGCFSVGQNAVDEYLYIPRY